jgi:hypothetical protein
VHVNRYYLLFPDDRSTVDWFFSGQVFDSASNWPPPVIYDGKYYLRTHDTRTCYGLRA